MSCAFGGPGPWWLVMGACAAVIVVEIYLEWREKWTSFWRR